MRNFFIENLTKIIKEQDPNKKIGHVSSYYCTNTIDENYDPSKLDTTSVTIYNFGIFSSYEDCESVVLASKIDFSNSIPVVVDGYYYRVKL